ncbi:MAG: hypothetical protein B6D61_08255 [Bacteroidetes bacterium 4484_249]|nr:MAG: hypothetical protein B6D61_08255 [Bacteroidetes bacterium 4484_249]
MIIKIIYYFKIIKMKKTILILLLVAVSIVGFAQLWKDNLPVKPNNEEFTFFEIQNAFNEYWKPYNVDNGYYNKNGQKTKARGWKQFKRWEWFWETRVDPVTGEFPKTTAWKEFEKYKSALDGATDDQANWINLGPYESPGGYVGLGRINCIGFHPNDNNTIYAGSPSGGLWKTADGGNSWIPLTDYNPVLGVSDIIVLPNGSTETIYIATGDRDVGSMSGLGGGQEHDNNSVGVLKSVDGGITWQTTGLSFTQDMNLRINRLLVHPNNSGILYAATSNGLYISYDAGNNWTHPTSTIFSDVEFKPGNPQIMYASSRKFYFPSNIYRSADGGLTWTSIKQFTNCIRVELAVTSDDPSRVYAVVAELAGDLKGIYRSNNSGLTFSKVFDGSLPTHNLLGWNCHGATPAGQGGYDLAIASDPNNADIVFIGGISTWKSNDGGNSWDISNFWEGSGIATSQMYRLSVSATYQGMVNAGLQDNGTKSLQDNAWFDVFPGDGMETIIDYTESNTQYTCQPSGSLYRTTNNWVTHDFIAGPVSGRGAWVTPVVLDPSDHNTIYMGYDELWKSDNQGNSWIQISNFGNDTTEKLKSIAISNTNSDIIYCASLMKLYKTTDGGQNWQNITGTLPVGQSYITYLTIKNNDPNTVWVAMGEYNEFGVYETVDGGATWTNISDGLPYLPVMCIIQNRQNTSVNELYAGTDRGIYVRTGASNWELFSNGLPNVVVSELEIYYDYVNSENSKLYAATFGRGLWVSGLLESRTELSLTVNLEGPFNGTSMESELVYFDFMPFLQPYNISPWFYNGNETMEFMPADIVDWVLIELRDAANASSAVASTAIARKAALLHSNGLVTADDGVSNLVFDNTVNENLFVVIYHRNHLGIMSSQPVIKTNGVYTYNFNGGQAYNSGMKNIGGTFVMIGGDTNSDGSVNSTDKSEWNNSAGASNYLPTDCNLNGQIDNHDKNDFILQNTGAGSFVPE